MKMKSFEQFNEKFELTDKMKDIIDFEKGYSPAFDEDTDELDTDPYMDDFYNSVMDEFEFQKLLPDNYDYSEIKLAITDYIY